MASSALKPPSSPPLGDACRGRSPARGERPMPSLTSRLLRLGAFRLNFSAPGTCGSLHLQQAGSELKSGGGCARSGSLVRRLPASRDHCRACHTPSHTPAGAPLVSCSPKQAGPPMTHGGQGGHSCPVWNGAARGARATPGGAGDACLFSLPARSCERQHSAGDKETRLPGGVGLWHLT